MVTFEHYTRVPTEYILVINACSAFLSPATVPCTYDSGQATEHPDLEFDFTSTPYAQQAAARAAGKGAGR
jgi:hypothetical protein